MSWRLRYAPHLGYRPPFRPQFADLVGTEDRVAHVRFAVEQGFAGVLYAAARSRPVPEQEWVGRAIVDAGLEAGCLLSTGFAQIRDLRWGRTGREARDWIEAELRSAVEAAQRVGASRLVVLGGSDPTASREAQLEAFVDNLRFGADVVGRAGMTLCLETLDRQRVPGMLLHHIADAHAIVRRAAHPGVRLVFDTAHVHAMDGDVASRLAQVWDAVEVIQLADSPGRFQPGTGEIDFAGVLRLAAARGYAGLVELEFDWHPPGAATERAGLEALHRLDAAIAIQAPG